MALRHRLGLPPSDSLLSESCLCSAAVRFADDPDHFQSCKSMRGAAITQRHDHLCNAIADLARDECGFVAQREPLHHMRTAELELEAQQRQRDAIAADREGELPKGYNAHGDILLVRHDTQLYVDATVLRTTAASLLTSRAVQTTPAAACAARAKAKHKTYDALCATNGYRMIAAVFESYGGIGGDSARLLDLLAPHCRSMSAKQFRRHALTLLGVCLQRGNATAALTALQKHSAGRLSLRLKAAHGWAARQTQQALKSMQFPQVPNTRLAAVVEPFAAAAAAAAAEAAAAPQIALRVTAAWPYTSAGGEEGDAEGGESSFIAAFAARAARAVLASAAAV